MLPTIIQYIIRFLTENREVSGFLEIKKRLNSRDQIAALNTALAEVD